MAIATPLANNNLELVIPTNGLEHLTGPELRRFGDAVIRKIKANLANGLDANGNRMRPYSKEYKQSEQYAAFGKSPTPNLKLTGDLWASMVVKDITPFNVIIGFDDSNEGAKAHGNFTGSYGKPYSRPSLARQFFGLPEEQVTEIKNKFKFSITSQLISEQESLISGSILSFIQRLTERVFE